MRLGAHAVHDLVDAVAVPGEGKPVRGLSALQQRPGKLALGDEGKKRLYDHFRENGRVPTRAVSDAINEIFTAVGQAKN